MYSTSCVGDASALESLVNVLNDALGRRRYASHGVEDAAQRPRRNFGRRHGEDTRIVFIITQCLGEGDMAIVRLDDILVARVVKRHLMGLIADVMT